MSPLAAWATKVLGCPRCGKPLKAAGTVLRCTRRCGVYPVLGGAPVLMPEPARWCAAFYESALAAMAEVGLADDASLSTLRAFAESMQGEPPERFGDDWTREELEGRAPPTLIDGVATQALQELITLSEVQSVREWLASRIEGDCVVEVGCGAGVLSEKLSAAKRLVVIDVSLRAVLQASQRSGGLPVVADATGLPLQKGVVDTLVAENVVDLIDAPDEFLTEAQRVLRKRGRLLISSPEPSLRDPERDDATLIRLAENIGFTVSESLDGSPWLRRHSTRHLEVYLVQGLSLTR